MKDPWPEGYGRRVLEKVDSTNAEAARLAPTLSGPEWVLALHQTAARGRRGRAWASPVGNFAASLVMRPGGGPQDWALRSFVASLALFDAFEAATGQADAFTLKWPNDVLLNGAKVAGILLESGASIQGAGFVTIGIGVNLRDTPDQTSLEDDAVPPASLLSGTGTRIDPMAFLELLAPAYARREHRFVHYGFGPIRAAWLARATKLGQEITARTTRESLTGVFETVDEAGNLVLRTAQMRHAIPAADIFF
ncbi:biotin--[acetyl-CoA-carboxylase] ligase [Roseovarius aestuariivivens]|uniref:biotin--[acetyl-CoA-carboxylase] ligase n=1 Tax=Roseovarius aestuariivivens TaxID=1888910 RepID=UPI00108209F6|nr:biotin--[acetyl-CoA-carboxylase] ligase [Roseovarius aestuariivivens]